MVPERCVIPEIVKNGVVVPQNDIPLPDGAHVDILISPTDAPPELEAELDQVVPLTTARAAMRFAGTTLIRPTAENGLRQASVALVFQLRTIDRRRIQERIKAKGKRVGRHQFRLKMRSWRITGMGITPAGSAGLCLAHRSNTKIPLQFIYPSLSWTPYYGIQEAGSGTRQGSQDSPGTALQAATARDTPSLQWMLEADSAREGDTCYETAP